MTNSRGDDDPNRLSPEEAFKLLGNETRIEILQSLWEAFDPYENNRVVSFSELYDRVEIEDTGNFNYHLGELVGHFVTETDDGYELDEPGAQVVRAIIAGTATEDPTLAPTPIDVSCIRCEGSVELFHEEGVTWVRCTECDGFWSQPDGAIFGFGLPPNGLRDRTPIEILDATIVYSLHRAAAMSDGVCPACGGTVDSSLGVCDDHDLEDGICETCGEYFLGRITFVCKSCKNTFRTPSWEPLTDHPAVVSFYLDHGIDHVHNSWESIRRCFGWEEQLRSMDPPRLEVTVVVQDEELNATIDETGTIVGIER